jgi:hypothetical protein
MADPRNPSWKVTLVLALLSGAIFLALGTIYIASLP